ncbi:MAG: hypothetical protein ABIA21_02170 [Candidatus Aenigmatarchaeota archaeon]
MKYSRINLPTREILVALEPTDFGAPYSQLFNNVELSGYELWFANHSNKFNNPIEHTNEELYRNKPEGFGELVRDLIRNGVKGTDTKNRLNITYISHAGLNLEKVHDVWVPENGYWVPTNDCEEDNGNVIPFIPGTLVPFETVKDRDLAMKRLEAKGIPKEQVAYFYRLDDYSNEMYVGRNFYPQHDKMDGRFFVDLHKVPSNSGKVKVGARRKFIESDDIVV